MARPILVVLLLLTFLSSGCAAPNSMTRAWDRFSERTETGTANGLVAYDHWLDDHPVVKATTIVFVLAGYGLMMGIASLGVR